MRFSSADDMLVTLAAEVLRNGSWIAPRHKPTKELLGVQFVLTNPRARIVTLPSRRFSLPLAIGELCWHLRGDDDLASLAYYADAWRAFSDDGRRVSGSCYGRKLLGKPLGGPSPWERLANLLRDDPSTRRATFGFIDNSEDLRESRDVSCVSNVQFLVREGKLHLFTFMRSNDLFLGLPYDVFLFSYLLELMSLELDLEIGEYHHFATSLHIYDRNIEACESMTRDVPRGAALTPRAAKKEDFMELARVEASIRQNEEWVYQGPFESYVKTLASFKERRAMKAAR